MKIAEKLLNGGKIGFFGFGISSVGILDCLSARLPSLSVTVRSDCDIGHKPPAGARLLIGKDAAKDIDEDVLFLSPSVRRDRPELVAAQKRGVILSSDTELFFELNQLPVIAVTGSSGKSSCTYLAAAMLSEAGINAAPAGNFGRSLCSTLGSGERVISELSSFQLNFFTPHTSRALITNLTPNHLNWHKDFREYAESKLALIEKSDAAVYDFDSPLLRDRMAKKPSFCAVSSALTYEELKECARAENYITFKNGFIIKNGERYIDISRARRCEEYNLKNYMLSTALTYGLCQRDAAATAINKFGGLPHRAELVSECNGIKYIDSSIDSTPERTLYTLGALEKEVAVILCGRGKGLSYDKLISELPRLTCGACIMGDIKEELSYELKERYPDYKIVFPVNMEDAVRKATELLPRGGTVLLSPSATSYDRYKSFEERGDDFKRAVMSFKD